MINPLIKKQLNDCKRCNVPYYNNDTTSIFIPKNSIKKDLGFTKDNCYLIQIEDYVVNPPSGFTLAQNWNGGTTPPSTYMNVCCIQVMGKMVKVDGISYDINNNIPLDKTWCGWIPVAAVKIIKEI